jgi:hypothetical protein
VSRDLSALSVSPNRAAMLGGRLPRLNPLAAAPEPDLTVELNETESPLEPGAEPATRDESTSPTVEIAMPERRPRRPASPRTTAGSPATGSSSDRIAAAPESNRPKGVIVYLNPNQTAFLKQVAEADGITYADVILDALERHWDALAGVWAARTRSYGLPPRQQRPSGNLRTQVQLKLRPDALAVLDSRVAETNAPSRNALIVKLVELDIAQLRDSPQLPDLHSNR